MLGDILLHSLLAWEPKRRTKILRRPGIEPGSTAWKAAMLTIIPPTQMLGWGRGFESGTRKACVGVEGSTFQGRCQHSYVDHCTFCRCYNQVKVKNQKFEGVTGAKIWPGRQVVNVTWRLSQKEKRCKLNRRCLYSSVAERWSCKPKVMSSILIGGRLFLHRALSCIHQIQKYCWPRRDSNTQPSDLESDALPLRHGVKCLRFHRDLNSDRWIQSPEC